MPGHHFNPQSPYVAGHPMPYLWQACIVQLLLKDHESFLVAILTEATLPNMAIFFAAAAMNAFTSPSHQRPPLMWPQFLGK